MADVPGGSSGLLVKTLRQNKGFGTQGNLADRPSDRWQTERTRPAPAPGARTVSVGSLIESMWPKWQSGTYGNPNRRTRCFAAGPTGRGEGGVMARAGACRRSPSVHANCDTCGQRPDVIHKPSNSGGACYCGDCCPVCKGASQRRRESDPACFQSRFVHSVCAKCGEDASPVHLPSGYLGRYCEKCCPVCKPAAAKE